MPLTLDGTNGITTDGTIDLGNADTTLARSSAGNVSIEGNVIYRAGGTDVVVADGGTGLSSATAYAVLCGGTTSTGAFQSIAGVGTSGQVLTSNGAGSLPTWQNKIVLATAVTSTSGANVEFFNIPSWVERITVMFQSVSTSGTAVPRVQIGTGGTATTSGYAGTAMSNSTGAVTNRFTDGFWIHATTDQGSGASRHGTLIITNLTGNTWTAFGIIGKSDADFNNQTSGSVTLSGPLDYLRINAGGNNFDAGTINIAYE